VRRALGYAACKGDDEYRVAWSHATLRAGATAGCAVKRYDPTGGGGSMGGQA